MNVIKQDGLLSLNHGLTAAVLRQLTYSTTRFAVYEVFMSFAITSVSMLLVGGQNVQSFLSAVCSNKLIENMSRCVSGMQTECFYMSH
jgi:dicarboxylate transporter 10